MKITVTDGKTERSADFREGSRASDIIAALGFGFDMPCGGKGRCGKCLCRIGGEDRLACKTQLFSDCRIELPHSETQVLTAEGRASDASGTVIDIGTTTVAAARFENGIPVKTFGTKNPQCAYGADVISRIGSRDKELTEVIGRLAEDILQDFGGPAVITGNTAMLALLCGMDTSEMGVHPFKMPSAFDTEFIGAYLPPCADAFVGADALCSMLYTGAHKRSETALMLDLGTNGEIGLYRDGQYYFTSTAAGPALEGANISRGMAAADGAVFRVSVGGYKTVGSKKPLGICGSGLVDAVALMLQGGALDSFGTLDSDFEIHDSGIFITQADIRAFQLCKAAISAGAKTLLKRSGLSLDMVDRIYLSGALGQNIDLSSAVRTGLLPDVPAEKIVPIGNGALMGGALLLKEENRALIRAIAKGCTCINLAADPEFTECYISEMNF